MDVKKFYVLQHKPTEKYLAFTDYLLGTAFTTSLEHARKFADVGEALAYRKRDGYWDIDWECQLVTITTKTKRCCEIPALTLDQWNEYVER